MKNKILLFLLTFASARSMDLTMKLNNNDEKTVKYCLPLNKQYQYELKYCFIDNKNTYYKFYIINNTIYYDEGEFCKALVCQRYPHPITQQQTDKTISYNFQPTSFIDDNTITNPWGTIQYTNKGN